MTKKNTLAITAILVLSPLIFSFLVHFFQDKQKESDEITVMVPLKPLENTNT